MKTHHKTNFIQGLHTKKNRRLIRFREVLISAPI